MWRCRDGESAEVGIAGVGWEGQSDAARAVAERDGCGDSVAAAGPADRAALPQSRPRSPTAGTGADAAELLPAAVVQSLSDPQAEDAIDDSASLRRFVRVELGDEVGPDETTLLRLRQRLEQHGLTQAIFNSITGVLEERRLLLRAGTIVDATIIAAPSSTKHASATRDPELKPTRKGGNWHFGMKRHIGADQRGIVHTVRATAAGVADITQLPDLWPGQERELFGDQAYWKEADRKFLEAWGLR